MGLGPGYAVTKHVKLVRVLGKGGMGSVWIADHLALKTQVAVKFMSDAYTSDPAMRTRFEREATSAAQIGSPHIVNVHDHGITSDGQPYIVMELLEGEDLAARIKREAPLPLDVVAKIVAQTCAALGKAHRRGVVHRDIKPNNIFLLDADGDIFAKVLDFGIAKPGTGESSEVTGTGVIVGTVIYAAPEQLLNAKNVDFRADLWSLGVVAYRAITGKLPFSDENGIGALALAMEMERFKPPSERVKGIPPEVDAWFERVFKRNPAARFESAREMSDAFFVALGRAPAPALTLERREDTESTAGPVFLPDGRATVVERSGSGSSPSTQASLGATAAKTEAGEAASETAAKTGSPRRYGAIAGVVVIALVSAGATAWFLVKRSAPVTGNASMQPSVNEPGAITTAAPSPAVVDPKAPEIAAPAASPAIAMPSASASSAVIPSSSSSGTGTKPLNKQGGTGRNPLPEKDYGF